MELTQELIQWAINQGALGVIVLYGIWRLEKVLVKNTAITQAIAIKLGITEAELNTILKS